MLAGDVAELQERLLKLAYQSVRKRVAEALLMYQRKCYPLLPDSTYSAFTVPGEADASRSEGRPAPVDRPDVSRPEGRTSDSRTSDDPALNTSLAMTLSRENWSPLVGASTETVIRILGDLRAEGLIEINASQITLLDIDKLTRLKR